MNLTTDMKEYTDLVESMPKRVRACIKAKGGHIKY
jgi:hypothetical protein